MDSTTVLKAMRVPLPQPDHSWNVFQVGCVSSPLNFASQQQRVFWLLWALDQAGLIRDKKIGIIGGGLSGTTAATACMKRGAQLVTLYDRNHTLMALQHGATHRYVHPYIFRWPEHASSIMEVRFPILSWKAGSAHAIRKEILKQAAKIRSDCWAARSEVRKRLEECHKEQRLSTSEWLSFQQEWGFENEPYGHRMGCEVRHLMPGKDDRIELLAEGHKVEEVEDRDEWLPVGRHMNYQRTYDVIIATVGYGLEAEFPGTPFRSYWDPDAIDGASILSPQPRRWLVSGTGDGGLIDTLRLMMLEADQKLLTDLLQGDVNSLDTLGNEQWKIDWQRHCRELRESLVELYANIRQEARNNSMTADEVSRIIHKGFSGLRDKHREAFQVLEKFVRKHERTDTIVYLNGRQEFPYELTAAPLQCFLVYLLRCYCGLRYRSGEFKLVSSIGQRPYRFQFDRKASEGSRIPISLLEVDEVVVRHGAESVFGQLFGAPVMKAVRENNCRLEFEEQLWEDAPMKDWLQDLEERIVLPTILENWKQKIPKFA